MGRPPDRRARVVEQIRAALRAGRLRPGTQLRTGIEDAAAWGTSHPTFRAALRDLEQTGELERAPRGFRVPFPTVRGSSTRVLWLSGCGANGTIAGESERESRLRRHLDLACRRDGLHLRVVGIDEAGRAFLEGAEPADLSEVLKDAFGVVLCPWRMGPEGLELAERLARTQLPAAVWAEGGIQGAPIQGGRTRVFDNGHIGDPGRGIGIHLRTLGHERIAFLSMYHGTDWSRRRLEGLLSSAGPGGSVVPLVSDGFVHPLQTQGSPPDILGPVTRRLGDRIRLFGQQLGEIEAACARLLREERLLRLLEPRFEEALSDASITAWVCSNDTQAIMAARWLRERGVRVPERISIAGFDDTNRGQDQGITSWSFSEYDLAEAMVRHLVSPMPGNGTIRIEGALVARGSTARRAEHS